MPPRRGPTFFTSPYLSDRESEEPEENAPTDTPVYASLLAPHAPESPTLPSWVSFFRCRTGVSIDGPWHLIVTFKLPNIDVSLSISIRAGQLRLESQDSELRCAQSVRVDGGDGSWWEVPPADLVARLVGVRRVVIRMVYEDNDVFLDVHNADGNGELLGRARWPCYPRPTGHIPDRRLITNDVYKIHQSGSFEWRIRRVAEATAPTATKAWPKTRWQKAPLHVSTSRALFHSWPTGNFLGIKPSGDRYRYPLSSIYFTDPNDPVYHGHTGNDNREWLKEHRTDLLLFVKEMDRCANIQKEKHRQQRERKREGKRARA
ncbi:hypothetical protein PENSPDRAFT_647744 [Peniophora sp. CONT]|nr:hypothetical protein PENSPDRAFT_647744 [Peniophora sp. CONT]